MDEVEREDWQERDREDAEWDAHLEAQEERRVKEVPWWALHGKDPE